MSDPNDCFCVDGHTNPGCPMHGIEATREMPPIIPPPESAFSPIVERTLGEKQAYIAGMRAGARMMARECNQPVKLQKVMEIIDLTEGVVRDMG